MIKIGCPSILYTSYRDSYSPTNSITLISNPCNFKCCYTARSQLDPPSKFCKLLWHTKNSVPWHYHSYAQTRGTMNYLWLSHMQGRSRSTQFSVFHISGPDCVLVMQPCLCLESFRCVEIFRCVWFNSRYVGLKQPWILASTEYFDMSANLHGIGGRKNPSNPVHQTHSKSQQRTSIDHMNMIHQVVLWTHSTHASDCILLGRQSLCPDMPRIASFSTECFFVTLVSCYSTKLHTIFTLIFFYLHSPTSLHHHQYGIYGQTGEESLFTEEWRSPAWESTCMCIGEVRQSSLPIKCLNFKPSLWV